VRGSCLPLLSHLHFPFKWPNGGNIAAKNIPPEGKRSRRKKNGMHLKRCYNTIWALCGISFGAINQSIPRIFFQPLEHKAGHFSKHFSV
jgi:hypothetical protein